jgi:hypothetical protein
LDFRVIGLIAGYSMFFHIFQFISSFFHISVICEKLSFSFSPFFSDYFFHPDHNLLQKIIVLTFPIRSFIPVPGPGHAGGGLPGKSGKMIWPTTLHG